MDSQVPAVVEGRVYQIMDAMDDEIIKAELENRVVKTWVYSYRGSDGKQVEGLSKVGVDACCTEMAKTGHVIREGEVKFSADPTNKEYILFMGQATRHVLDGEKHIEMEVVNGTKRQWIKMKRKDGSIVDDPFWFEKGAMKALRNARSRLIPEEIRTKIITFARQQNRVKEVQDNGYVEPERTASKGGMKEFLAAMADLKKEAGDEVYYGILAGHGVKHANELKARELQVAAYKELMKAIEGLKAASEVFPTTEE